MATIASINFIANQNLLYNQGVGYAIGTYEVEWNGTPPSFYHVYIYSCSSNVTHDLYETDGGDTNPEGAVITRTNITSANAGQTGFMFKVFDNSGEVEYDTIQVCRSVTFHEPPAVIVPSDIFSTSDTVYKITKDIDLNEAQAEIASNCVLDFQGGSISNGSIVGNDTIVIGKANITANYTGLLTPYGQRFGEFEGGLRVVTFDELDNLRIDLQNVNDTSLLGEYLVKTSTSPIPCARLTVVGDSMYHCIIQKIEGNIEPNNSSGVMDGTHNDTKFNQYVRVYNLYSTNLTNVPTNTWGNWVEVNSINVNQSN